MPLFSPTTYFLRQFLIFFHPKTHSRSSLSTVELFLGLNLPCLDCLSLPQSASVCPSLPQCFRLTLQQGGAFLSFDFHCRPTADDDEDRCAKLKRLSAPPFAVRVSTGTDVGALDEGRGDAARKWPPNPPRLRLASCFSCWLAGCCCMLGDNSL